jgi:hypothetical protein
MDNLTIEEVNEYVREVVGSEEYEHPRVDLCLNNIYGELTETGFRVVYEYEPEVIAIEYYSWQPIGIDDKKLQDKFIAEFDEDYEEWFYGWYDGDGDILREVMDIIKIDPDHREMFIRDWENEYMNWLSEKYGVEDFCYTRKYGILKKINEKN